MADILHSYETFFVVRTSLGEEGIQGMIEKIKTLISDNGTVESVDEWGKRKLAYEIQKETEGYYVLVNFKSNPDFPKELDRIYKITDGIIRSIIVRTDV